MPRKLNIPDDRWPNARIVGGQLSQKASDAVARQCNGDTPWMVLVPSGFGGVMACFEDRLCIIKTGVMTSLLAGSLGGERSAAFFLRDITGIEYNSGMLTGVLEVLTASYNGTANRDYWRGTNRSRNADSNDPFTLSNTLPLAKFEFKNALSAIQELRLRIAQSKEGNMPRPAADSQPSLSVSAKESLSEELETLAKLFQSGILTSDEFHAAKQRLLG